jgi:hypothetical protein
MSEIAHSLTKRLGAKTADVGKFFFGAKGTGLGAKETSLPWCYK